MGEEFKVEIVNPEKSFLLKEDVTEVIVPAFEGEMGILKEHISIISFLKPGIITILAKTGEEKFYELSQLITNLGGPIKSRYINLDLKLEGLAGDFEKILEMNEHRIRDKALSIMGGYSYEDAQLDGFQERVRVDLKKGFSSVLRKYRDGESDLIRQIYFMQFVVQ